MLNMNVKEEDDAQDEVEIEDNRKILQFYLDGPKDCGKSAFFHKIGSKGGKEDVLIEKVNIQYIFIEVNENYKVQLHKTEINSLIQPDAIIMMYDVTDEKSLNYIKNRINMMKQEQFNIKGISFCLVEIKGNEGQKIKCSFQ